MANYQNLLNTINGAIRTNGTGAITGQLLQTILDGMVASLGAKYQYAGVATPSTNPGTPDENVFYLAAQAGTYTNFGGLVVNDDEVCALKWDGTWAKDVTGAATAEQVNQLGQYTEDSEYVRVVLDADGKFLYGVRVNGEFVFGEGIPKQIQDFVISSENATAEEIKDLLAGKVDKEFGKSLIDSDVADSIKYEDDNQYVSLEVDKDGRILSGRKFNGRKEENSGLDIKGGVSTESASFEDENDDDFVSRVEDNEKRILSGIKKDGTYYFNNIEVNSEKHKTYYAHNFGILPENDALTNAVLLNDLLSSGNIELRITIPGTYKLGSSVKLGSNTRLICSEGVIFTREGTFRNVFINAGASTATFNDNITLDGVHLIITQSGSHIFNYSDPLFGLRGLVAFCFVNKLTIRNLAINSIDGWEFALHINRAEQVIVEHFDIRCEKDGIHVASLRDFVFRDGIISTDDDGIGLNGYDFYDCNLVAGDVKYGVIEKITTLRRNNSPHKGSGVRMMVGAFVDWYDGIKVMNSELVRYGSRVYKVIDEYDSEQTPPSEKVEYISHTPPTITTYNGCQADAGGFYWKLNDVDSYQFSNRIDVSDIVFRDIKINQGGYFIMQDVWPDGSNTMRRTLHPDVLPENYPHTDHIILENIVNYGSVSPRVFETYTPVITDARLTNIIGFLRKFECPVVSFNGVYAQNAKKRVILDNYDFTSVDSSETEDVKASENTEIILKDCKNNRSDGNLIVDSDGSIVSNCSISSLPANPKKGDTLILDGVFKCFDGTIWR